MVVAVGTALGGARVVVKKVGLWSALSGAKSGWNLVGISGGLLELVGSGVGGSNDVVVAAVVVVGAIVVGGLVVVGPARQGSV